MKSRKTRIIAFVLGMAVSLVFPLQVNAAEKGVVTREKVFTTELRQGQGYEELAAFEQEIIEGNKHYKLEHVDYEILEVSYLDTIEKVVESETEPSEKLTEGELEFCCVKSEKEEVITKEPSIQTVNAYDDYHWTVTEESVPKTKDVTVINESTGKPENVTCSLTGIAQAGTAEVNNTMTITFQEYDAAYYEWNGNYIPKNDALPALVGYENQLLSSVGASPDSRILGVAWAGDPYVSEEGILCRDAAAEVQQMVPVYRANYEGRIAVEAQRTVRYKNTYEAPDPNGRAEYRVRATASYTEMRGIFPAVLTGVGIFLLICCIIGILLVIARKRGKKKNGST